MTDGRHTLVFTQEDQKLSQNVIDARTLYRCFLAGAKRLDSKKEWINELNVFPVPDGDTGTNMTMTIMSASKEVMQAGSDNMEAICKAISSGSLRGARGNSGVILSQLLRGFTKVARELDSLDADALTDAFDKAVETAYKAVMKPKEGTILTVAKGMFQKAQELSSAGETDLDSFLDQIIVYGDEVLAKTPDLLPVLKQAGVVDSGGQGLMEFMRGALEGLRNEDIDLTFTESKPSEAKGAFASGAAANIDTSNIKFAYCTEFIILLKSPLNKKQEKEFRIFLDSMGDSIVMVPDEDLCKIHVHSNDPGLVIQKALTYGELSNLKIDNMKMEHRERLFHMTEGGKATEIEANISGMAEQKEAGETGFNQGEPAGTTAPEPAKEHKAIGFVTVCAGKGLEEIFKSLGVDEIISGGQTMNPSTADILDAAACVDADTIFILPNNKNIILAAEQAVKMSDDKDIRVIPTKTVPQGIAALLGFLDGVDADENETSMKEALAAVKSGEVTYAVRDTTIDDVEIHKGQYMGIGDAGILDVDNDREGVVLKMLKKLTDEETALISIYYGADIEEEVTKRLSEQIEQAFSGIDVELQYGGQPVYSYLVSVE